MKLNKFFIAALAAMTMFSCSKEQGGTDNPVAAGQKAKLTVSVANEGTKAIGQNEGNTDRDVANFVAIAVDANGVIVGSGVGTSALSASFETTTAAKKLLVISNLNSKLVTGGESVIKSTITNMQALTAILDATDLANGTAATIDGTPNSVWSAGEETITWSGDLSTAGDAYEENVSVSIRPVAAKISLKVTVPAKYGATPGNFRFVDANGDGIMALNAVSNTKFFGAKAFSSYTDAAYPWLVPAVKSYYSGMDISSATDYVHNNANTVKAFLKDNFDGPANGTSETYYNYYIFENDADKATDHATIVTLRGTWGMSLIDANFDAGVTEAQKAEITEVLKERAVYFAVHLTSLDAGKDVANYGKGVQRGKCYKVAINLTDNVFTDDYKFPDLPITGPVVPPVTPPTDPTEEITKANINVTVTVENWTGVDIGKQW